MGLISQGEIAVIKATLESVVDVDNDTTTHETGRQSKCYSLS